MPTLFEQFNPDRTILKLQIESEIKSKTNLPTTTDDGLTTTDTTTDDGLTTTDTTTDDGPTTTDDGLTTTDTTTDDDPTTTDTTTDDDPTTTDDDDDSKAADRYDSVLNFCSIPRSRLEIQEFLHLKNKNYFFKAYLNPLLESGKLEMTIPDKPNSKNQKYVVIHSS
jgi:hypothetical protein